MLPSTYSVTVSKAAREFGVQPATIRRWCNEGRLEFRVVRLQNPVAMPRARFGAQQPGARTHYRRISRESIDELKLGNTRAFCEEALRSAERSEPQDSERALRYLAAAGLRLPDYQQVSDTDITLKQRFENLVERVKATEMRRLHEALTSLECESAVAVCERSEAVLHLLNRLGVNAPNIRAAIDQSQTQLVAFRAAAARDCLNKLRSAYEAFDEDHSTCNELLNDAELLLGEFKQVSRSPHAVEQLQKHLDSMRRRLDTNV